MEEQFSGEFWMAIQDQISEVAIEYDQIWRKRIRLIGTELLFLFIFKLVLSKNKQGYGSLLIELWDNSSDKMLIPLISDSDSDSYRTPIPIISDSRIRAIATRGILF